MRQVCDGEVEHFADFAAEIPRRAGLLQNGLLNGVEQGNIGAKAGGNWAHFAQRKLGRKSKENSGSETRDFGRELYCGRMRGEVQDEKA
jgi:hypothetical protein